MRYLFDQVQMSHGARLAVRGTFGKGSGRRGAACCTGKKSIKKARTAAGLFGRVDRLGVSVPVALNTDGHMGHVRHSAVVEV